MQCSQCHTENLADAAFCEECAAPLEAACASCGTGNRPSAKFCRKCRAPLGAAAAPSPAPTRDPRTYTPKHLADKILQSKSALEGERKQVTVLFADVKGSMDLAAQLDPEEWHRILERFFEILTEGVHRFEGTVNQYTGDGIMALFGAPIAHEDHAQRACYAALHLAETLKRYADALRVEHGLNFSVRMGINSGEVVVGKIGDDLRMDYTAQGHTVGLAQRMEALAESGKALLAESTIDIVHGYFALRDLGATKVKGLDAPVRVAELEGVGRMRTRLDRSRARGLSKFVGREEEMGRLETALRRSLEGDGQAIGVMAEAGSGKSRLCFEFLEQCRARGITVRSLKAQKNVLDLFRPFVRRLADDGLIPKVPKFPSIQVPEVEVQVIDPETQDRVLQAIAWERRGAFLALAREALRPSEVRAADLDDYDSGKGTLRVNKTIQGARLDARVTHTKNRTARVKEVWDQQLREWLEWRLAQASPKRRLRGETALFPNPTARNTKKRWTVSGLEREWKRACTRAGVDYIPLQQGTRHSILTMLGQTLPERVLRDFSRHRDARSLDRYSKPRATRSAIVRAFPGLSPFPGPQSADKAEPRGE